MLSEQLYGELFVRRVKLEYSPREFEESHFYWIFRKINHKIDTRIIAFGDSVNHRLKG